YFKRRDQLMSAPASLSDWTHVIRLSPNIYQRFITVV
ncbi:MAG: hypothetical protein ACJAR0_004372, partial [Candidatus Azotimanducaceae bacterium]